MQNCKGKPRGSVATCSWGLAPIDLLAHTRFSSSYLIMEQGNHLVLYGQSALSSFRADRLKRLVQDAVAQHVVITSVRAHWRYHVILKDDSVSSSWGSASPELAKLRDLFSATGHVSTKNHKPEACSIRVAAVSRRGTFSPWSSEATNIVHDCGLHQVERVDRSQVFEISFDSEQVYDVESLPFATALHDRMTQSLIEPGKITSAWFKNENLPAEAELINLHADASTSRQALQEVNQRLGLVLDDSDMEYLQQVFRKGGPCPRSPTDVELFMYSQVNSEHCRHKLFNAQITIDGERKDESLFAMIRSTHIANPKSTISAYSDNAAVLEGPSGYTWSTRAITGEWIPRMEQVHFLGKVETHNHPTAVSPYPGAATGSGGEIRDEGAVGRGSKPKAGLAGFNVSQLQIPGAPEPWEVDYGKPEHIASGLEIMLEAPIGSAAFNNEFGRPCLTGYFRTLLDKVATAPEAYEMRGYHKPIMIAGGVGTVRPSQALKDPSLVRAGDHLVVLGGPAMLIGLGGGAASSQNAGDGSIDLDFASVQRANPEMQRRAQMVIDACTALGINNPIGMIHDVGAGGLSNALPEIVHDAGLGATFHLRDIHSADSSLSPLQIWCCEAQERYVMTVAGAGLSTIKSIAKRERCPLAVVGRATGPSQDGTRHLKLTDDSSSTMPTLIDMPMDTLFGKSAKEERTYKSRPIFRDSSKNTIQSLVAKDVRNFLSEAASRVLRLPCVGSKSFLVTIGDRSVGGLTARDQMVGRWQTPVADVAVTATSLRSGGETGEAMAMGERPLIALSSPAASARMAVAEALTNLAAANVKDCLERVRLSANWMVASAHPGEMEGLYDAVRTVTQDMCIGLGISIPVGKDSTSMKMKWKDADSGAAKEVTSPLSLVVTAFAPVADISKTWTPALRRREEVGETVLVLVDLAIGRKALGGSALAQVFSTHETETPDVHDIDLLRDYYYAMDELHDSDIVLAYHDRSDGGLFATVAEMMFAGRVGVEISLDAVQASSSVAETVSTLFNEELGGIFQIRRTDIHKFHSAFSNCGPPAGLISKIGTVTPKSRQRLRIGFETAIFFDMSRAQLQQMWSITSHRMQRLRDNPDCADQEYQAIVNDTDPGLSYKLTFSPKENIMSLYSSFNYLLRGKPRVAILREQGTNGYAEMAFAFHSAGFIAIDVHMTDIISGRVDLATFTGLAACGGFSYGDVLGAGQGWAKSVLYHRQTKKQFSAFFERQDTFTLGVCNGCQFLSKLKEIIPGADAWPSFVRNTSEQYEARVCMVEVYDNPRQPSVFLHGMAGSRIPTASAHGEGRALFAIPQDQQTLKDSGLVSMRFVDSRGQITEQYPANPNGSPGGITGLRTPDGRVLAMMPHPERTVMKATQSWYPAEQAEEWGDFGPWIRIFRSARRWAG